MYYLVGERRNELEYISIILRSFLPSGVAAPCPQLQPSTQLVLHGPLPLSFRFLTSRSPSLLISIIQTGSFSHAVVVAPSLQPQLGSFCTDHYLRVFLLYFPDFPNPSVSFNFSSCLFSLLFLFIFLTSLPLSCFVFLCFPCTLSSLHLISLPYFTYSHCYSYLFYFSNFVLIFYLLSTLSPIHSTSPTYYFFLSFLQFFLFIITYSAYLYLCFPFLASHAFLIALISLI